MIDAINQKALAYTVARELDPDTFRKLEQEDGPNLMKVVRNVIETETPSWVFYFVSECSDELTEPANQIPSVVPKGKFLEKAEDYAERDQGVIDLTNPASQDWMSDDPMKHPRNQYQERLASIQSAIESELVDRTEMDADEASEAGDRIMERIDPLQWEVNRVKNGENGKATDTRVAELYVSTATGTIEDILDNYITVEEVDWDVEREVLEMYKLTDKKRQEKIESLREDMDDSDGLF